MDEAGPTGPAGPAGASAPAGWLPDPERPAALLRYWDGARWTEHTSVRAAPPPPAGGPLVPHLRRLPLPRGWRVLSLALQGALGLGVVVGLAQVLEEWWAGRTVADAHRDLLAGRYAAASRSADRVDLASGAASLAVLAALLLAGVPFLIWLHQVYLSDRLAPGAVRFSQTWALGGWFCPLLNLFRPLQVVNDVRAGARSAAGLPASTAAAVLTGAWWTLWLATNLTSVVGRAVAPDGPEGVAVREVVSGHSTGEAVLAVHGLLFAGAALLALVVVRSTSRDVLAVDPARPPSTGQPAFTWA